MRIENIKVDISAPNEGALRTSTFRYILDNLLYFPTGTRLADLGAGPCIFSEIAVSRGYAVTAIDGRDERKPENLKNIDFIKDDVRNFNPHGFDIVLILGLLYHLTLEDQILLLTKCSPTKCVIIDTQVHIPELIVHPACATRNNFASKLVTQGPYTGVLFPEENNPMASIGNKLSWWHTEESLNYLYKRCGFRGLTNIAPAYVSKYGARRWYILR